MKTTVPVEQVRVGDTDPETGKKVVEVLHRFDRVIKRNYVRAILEGGWPIIDGYHGDKVTIHREETPE